MPDILHPNMYQERTNSTNLRTLANLQDINNITAKANGLLGKQSDGKDLAEEVLRARRIEFFYDKMLLDTIKLGSENNVFLKYCSVKSVPNGHEKLLLRRWGSLTEHTVPLPEGVPPVSDAMNSESFIGTYQSYGRYMEFTDRVDFMLIDPVIAHYSMEMGDLAVRMSERLVREELIRHAGENFPHAKTFSSLVIGDTVGIADYRLQALKFKRLLIKPLSGKFVVICSPEHIYDLVSDPLIKEYMLYTQTAEPYMTGQPVGLFDLRFEETMLDDFAYGYTEMSNPGEYQETVSGTITNKVRLVVTNIATGEITYLNATAGETNSTSAATIKREVKAGRLKDGSWIPSMTKWDIKGWQLGLASGNITTLKADGTTQVVITAANLKDPLKYTINQLPVHRSFMFGQEFIYKTGIDGRMNSKFYVKEKGSAGVLDPIDQRQSIGFKIDTLGFNCVRPEAMVQYIFVPEHALMTYQAVMNDLDIHYNTTYKSAADPNNKTVIITPDNSSASNPIE